MHTEVNVDIFESLALFITISCFWGEENWSKILHIFDRNKFQSIYNNFRCTLPSDLYMVGVCIGK